MSTFPVAHRLPRRLVSLYLGLLLFGASMALMIASRLGLGPWDVLHQGLVVRTGVSYGWVVIALGAFVLLLWIPLRQRPGLGTLSNVIVIGLAVEAALAVLPQPGSLSLRVVFLVTGIVANGIATGLYIGAGLGPGPRDGLMTGLAKRGHSIRLMRTLIELSVLAVGWLLGGTVGAGTVLYAVTIGPLVHYFIPRLAVTGDGTAKKGDAETPAVDAVTAPHRAWPRAAPYGLVRSILRLPPTDEQRPAPIGARRAGRPRELEGRALGERCRGEQRGCA
jgi:uncharacterized membrane protein YczE